MTLPAQQADQIFVILQHRLASYLPVPLQSIADVILSVIAIVVVFAFLFAVTTVLERKGLGRIQNRYGPNRVGPAGFFQPVADGIKSLTKEDLVPRTADQHVRSDLPVADVRGRHDQDLRMRRP